MTTPPGFETCGVIGVIADPFVNVGIVGYVIATLIITVMETSTVTEPAGFEAVIRTMPFAVAVGVPLIVPLAELTDKPEGSAILVG